MRRYFGTDGVRGIVGRDLTPALVERLEQAALPFILSIIGEGPEEATLRGALDTPSRRSRIRFLAWQTHEKAA